MIIGITGKSGSGKTYISDLLAQKRRIAKITTYTTRPIREGEIEGMTYHYLTNEQFNPNDYILVNHIVDKNWWYGTNKEDIESKLNRNEDFILVVDPIGVREIKRLYPNDSVIINLNCDDKIRMIRSLCRENKVDCLEIAKRFIRDERDFENLRFDLEIDNNGDAIDTVLKLEAKLFEPVDSNM